MKRHAFSIFILAIIMISLPLHLRFAHSNPTIAGIEPYYHARIAIDMQDGIPEKDNSIVNGREYTINPYHFLLAIGYKLAGPLAFNIIPAILALATFILFWQLLKKINTPEETIPWMLLTYALSPPLVATGIIGTPHSFALVLLLSATLLMLNNRWILSTILFTIASLTGLTYNIAAITLVAFIALTTKKDNNKITITTIISATILIIGKYPATIPLEKGITQYVSDLGGIYGFSIFALLLAIVGATTIWEHKKKYYTIYALFITFIIINLFIPELIIFTNILISALAGTALATLAQRTWKLTFLRQAALLVLFCGLLFSSISHAVSIADTPPTQTFFKAIQIPPTTIFTHENYGFWIELAGHKAITDPLWKQLPDPEEQNWDSAALYKQTELEKANQLLRKYNITHILITPEMQHGLVWEREEEGLDFLVKNSETFKRIETGSNIQLWQTK